MTTLTDEEYFELIEEIKSQRPVCSDPEGHFFISYYSEGVQICAACGYEEEIIIK